MRVALISYEFPPVTLGGIGTYARHAARMFAARGHEVTVFAGSGDSTEREVKVDGIRVVRLRGADRGTFHVPAVRALAARHAQQPFDVAEVPDQYAQGTGLRAAAPGLPIVLRAHMPTFLAHEVDYCSLSRGARRLHALRRILGGLSHGESWRKIWKDARARIQFRAHYDLLNDFERTPALDADLVASPSRHLAARVQEAWQIPAEKIRVVPNPHQPLPALSALPVPQAGRTIAFHGGVHYLKGVHVLMAAMPLVLRRHPQARLVLAGTSLPSPVVSCSWRAWRNDTMIMWRDTIAWLRPQLDALGDKVQVRGFLSPVDLAQHLAAADLCVFPSLWDNFPSACLEAMSAARPIVATRSGGMEDMLGNGEAGLLVPCGDARALADAICRLIADPLLRLQLATRARERLTANYTPAVLGPRYDALYAEVKERRR